MDAILSKYPFSDDFEMKTAAVCGIAFLESVLGILNYTILVICVLLDNKSLYFFLWQQSITELRARTHKRSIVFERSHKDIQLNSLLLSILRNRISKGSLSANMKFTKTVVVSYKRPRVSYAPI